MKRSFTFLLLSLWVVMGIIWYNDYSRALHSPDSMRLRDDLNDLYSRVKDQGKFIDEVPFVFRRYPSVGAIFLFNEKNLLLGSLYEAQRVSKELYRELLSRKKEMLEKKIKRVMVLPFSDKMTAVLYLNPDIPTLTIIKNLISQRSELKWTILFYFFVFFVMAVLLVVFSDRKKSIPVKREKPKAKIILSLGSDSPSLSGREVSSSQVPPQDEEPDVEKPAEPLEEDTSQTFFYEKALNLMGTLEQKYGALCVRYYFWDTVSFRPVVQKQGGIIVRGEAVKKLGGDFSKIAQNPEVQTLKDGRLLAIPLVYRNALIGLLLLDFQNPFALSGKDKKQIIDVCSTFSQSIFLHRIYNAATVDPETDFFTYPYFYFYLKERLKSEGVFLTFIFELPEINRISPQSMRGWAKNMVYKLEHQGFKPEICVRIDRQRFAFVFEFPDYHKEGGLSRAERIPGYVEKFTKESLGTQGNLHGGFFIKPAKVDSVDSFMQRLEYVLIESRLNPNGIATLIEPHPSYTEKTGENTHRIGYGGPSLR